MPHTIYTYGYQGTDPLALKTTAADLGVRVVDIRLRAWSHDRHWTAPALAKLLGRHYVQVPAWGNRNYQNDGPIQLVNPDGGLRALVPMLKKQPILLLCQCADYVQCHRLVAANLLQEHTGAPVEHLVGLVTAGVKCISLTPPWGSLVHIGAKRFETRSWATSYRGPLLIHQTKGLADMYQEDFVALCQSEPFLSALTGAGYRGTAQLPRGAILCAVDLVDCIRITKDNAPPEPEQSFGDYTAGRFMWDLQNVRPLPEPVPARGMQQLWTPESAVLRQIEAMGVLG